MIEEKKQFNPLKKIRECIDRGHYKPKAHQKQRERERCVTRAEVLYVLKNGKNNLKKGGFDSKNQRNTYAICGRTIDGRQLEIIVAFDQKHHLEIITTYPINNV